MNDETVEILCTATAAILGLLVINILLEIVSSIFNLVVTPWVLVPLWLFLVWKMHGRFE